MPCLVRILLDSNVWLAILTTDGQKNQVRSRTTKVKLLDRLGAIRDIGKHIGMFNEKMELTGRNGGPIEMKTISQEDVVKRLRFVLTKAIHNSEGKTI